jgi:rRNA maturation protein Nop10
VWNAKKLEKKANTGRRASKSHPNKFTPKYPFQRG